MIYTLFVLNCQYLWLSCPSLVDRRAGWPYTRESQMGTDKHRGCVYLHIWQEI